ncbi:glycosyltransferase family 2 protein [Larkinella soli]|uniref:glycosyltransferase family 2 protein n=1 Tax=Larkinella soli TaxID=1770527 RepID=UPI000FFBC95A|nr:glycosyltransferase family 2 protein [Larkinella soli]
MIFIVIPVHNRKEFTRQCLQCLAEQRYRNFRIVVVDDGSTDGTQEMVRQSFPEVVLRKGNGHLWWTEATNEGVRYALNNRTDGEQNFVLTLNDDTRVGSDYLQSLMDAYDQKKPCMIGSVSVDADDPEKLEYAGTIHDFYFAKEIDLKNRFKRNYGNLAGRAVHLESHSLPGRGTLIPLYVFDTIGLYDSRRFIHYMSDIEFSVRARKAGFPLIVNVKSVVHEYVRATGLFVAQGVSWKQFFSSFSSIKSPTNLKTRYHFALAHSKTKLIYFLLDLGRISAGFLLRKIRTNRVKNSPAETNANGFATSSNHS